MISISLFEYTSKSFFQTQKNFTMEKNYIQALIKNSIEIPKKSELVKNVYNGHRKFKLCSYKKDLSKSQY